MVNSKRLPEQREIPLMIRLYNKRTLFTFLFIAIAFFFLLLGSMAAETKKEFNPPIREVTIYPDRALVNRRIFLSLDRGKYRLIFRTARPGLNTRSLRAYSTNSNIVIQGISSRIERMHQEDNTEVRKRRQTLDVLKGRRRDLNREIERIKQDLRGVRRYYSYLSRVISENSTGVGGKNKAAKWRRARKFLVKRELKAGKEMQSRRKRRRKLNEKIHIAYKRLRKLQAGRSKSIRIVTISVQALRATRGTVGFSYMIRGASWNVSYGMYLRANKNIFVEYFGNIKQTTGEDWKNVVINLSTARPELGAERPLLRPLHVYGRKAKTKQIIVMRQERVPAAETLSDGRTAGKDLEKKEGFSSIKTGGASLVFRIKKKADIPSIKRSYRVTIAEFNASKPDLYYRIVGSQKMAAYLATRTMNKQSFPLMAGPVDIFRTSGFIGRSHLKYTAPGSKFQAGFGLEREIRVKRTVLHKSRSAGTLSSNRVYETYVSLVVKNHGRQAREVRVFERIPVSGIEDIEVKIKNNTTSGYREIRKDSGILVWKYRLRPGQTRKIRLRYTVEAPGKAGRNFFGR